ncbi:MAG: L-lactate permease [Candidatus Shapirobacteria bacterium]
MPAYMAYLSLIPFVLFCLLLIFHHRSSLLHVSFYTLLVTLFLVIFFWHTPTAVILQSSLKGFLVALDILFIIFGAILFLEILKKAKIVGSLACHLENFSRDLRLQVILLAWFLENFLEGIAGFGTPSTVVAPLLVALGISPFSAVVIALLGNSTSVPFGAAGTPIRVGLAGLNLDLNTIAITTAKINFIGLLVPVFMLLVLVSKQRHRQKLFFEGLPFAIWSGVAFVLPAYFISLFGYEFPSIIGSIIGLGLVLLTSRLGLFVPKNIFRLKIKKTTHLQPLTFFKTLAPYGLFVLLLIAGKFLFSKATFSLPFLNHSISLFNPGFVFIATSFIVFPFLKIKSKPLKGLIKSSFIRTLEPFFVVAIMSIIVQLMNNSGDLSKNIISITKTIAGFLNTSFLPYFAPFIGAFGSFITGSATVSNLMFGSSLYSSGLLQHLSPQNILSLALVGAGAGNMIALADVLVAATVLGISHSLRRILLAILPYCLIYLIITGVIGLIFL